jgi:hypothetical protein
MALAAKTAGDTSFRQGSTLTFYHPDYTVGPGVSPDHGECRPERIVNTVDEKTDP